MVLWYQECSTRIAQVAGADNDNDNHHQVYNDWYSKLKQMAVLHLMVVLLILAQGSIIR